MTKTEGINPSARCGFVIPDRPGRTPAFYPTMVVDTLRLPLGVLFDLFAQLSHDLEALADVGFAEADADRRGRCQEAGIKFAVAGVAFRRQPHEL